MYGLHPRKGTIAVGADADIVIWETGVSRVIRNQNLHHNVDYTPYEGRTVHAWPAVTLSRGVAVYEDGQFTGSPGEGRFLRCDRPEPARPRPVMHRKLPWLDMLAAAQEVDA
jgi:dihydropyrimidinase